MDRINSSSHYAVRTCLNRCGTLAASLEPGMVLDRADTVETVAKHAHKQAF